jgi:hypothetical protein
MSPVVVLSAPAPTTTSLFPPFPYLFHRNDGMNVFLHVYHCSVVQSFAFVQDVFWFACLQARIVLILYRWDDWVPQDRLRKYNDENLELSKNLRQEMNAQRRAAAKPMTATVTRKRDLNTGSARGSEERTAPAAAPTRGTKRGREYEGIDKVSGCFLHGSAHLRILRGCVV